ncbi:MAG: acyl carrier protein [Oscillospiraceae bacterium]
MVFEKVKNILVNQLDANPDDITLDTSIIDDLGADSLDVVDLIMSLEDEFDLEVPDEDIEGIRTVGDLVKYIEDHTDKD